MFGRDDSLPATLEQTVALRLQQLRLDVAQRQRAARLEQLLVEALDQAQRIEHELEGQVGGGDAAFVLHRRSGSNLRQILLRPLPAQLAQHAVVQRQLAVRTGADTQIVAEVPVVEVVPALAAGLREGRGFVVLVTGCRQSGFDRILHVGAQVRLRQRRRAGGKGGVGFDRQLIAREVSRRERQCRVDVCQRLFEVLTGQAVHQVEVQIVEVAGRHRDRLPRLPLVVDAAECLQVRPAETLDAERETIDAGGAKSGKPAAFDRSGIGLERDLGTGQERQAAAQRCQQLVDDLAGEQARRAAADEDAVDAAAPDQRQSRLEIGDQGRQVVALRDRRRRSGRRASGRQCMRVEIAVRALAHTPRDMDVKRQRRHSAKLRLAVTGGDQRNESARQLAGHQRRLCRRSTRWARA